MRPKILVLVVALAVVFSVGVPKAFATNLITNGGFETGDFTGWTTGGNFEDTEVVSGAFYAYTGAQEGNFYAVLGPVGSDATLSQTFSDTVGAHYTFSFWLNAVGDSPSDFSASWDGTQLLSLSDPNTGGAWTQYSYTATGTGLTPFHSPSGTIPALSLWTTFRCLRERPVLPLSRAASSCWERAYWGWERPFVASYAPNLKAWSHSAQSQR